MGSRRASVAVVFLMPLEPAGKGPRGPVSEECCQVVEAGGDVNDASRDSRGYSPLHWAVVRQHLECAEWLLGHGARANAKDRDRVTPLHLAAGNGQADMCRLLLAKGAKVATRGCLFTPLQSAIVGFSEQSSTSFGAKEPCDTSADYHGCFRALLDAGATVAAPPMPDSSATYPVPPFIIEYVQGPRGK